MVHDIDREVTDGLSVDELSEMLIAYAQENERLSQENEDLRQQVNTLLQASHRRLRYVNDVRAAETAVRRFVSDPAIAPYIPDMDTVMARLFGEPIPYGGDAT